MKIIVERGGQLTPKELTKDSREWRAELFLRKCKENSPFTVRNTGEEVVVDSEGSFSEKTLRALEDFVHRKKPFTGNFQVNVRYPDGKEDILPLGGLEKTKEFGGGGGVAGGSEQTVVVEAGQCVCCALAEKSNISEKNLENLTASELSSLNVSIGKITPEALALGISNLDATWKKVLIQIAKALTEKLQGGYWHWQDSFTKSISEIYSKLPDKLPGTFDRYNPADIWYTKRPCGNVQELLGEKTISSLKELSEALSRLYDENEAVGISLKKTTNPSLEEFNEDKRARRIELDNIAIKPRREGTTTVTIFFKEENTDYECQIRQDGERLRCSLKARNGKNHFDGSVGMGIILHCLAKVFPAEEVEKCRPAFYRKEVEQMTEEYILNHPGMFREEDILVAEDYLEGNYPIFESEKPELFEEKINNTKSAVAKALDKIVELLQNAPESDVKEFLGRLIRYAWSLHSESCTFLKVH